MIHKQYDLELQVGLSINKKIAFENKDSKKHVFGLKSSDPEQMFIRQEKIEIPGNSKDKMRLKFFPIDSECTKKFVVFIKRGGKDHENILLNVNYRHPVPH